MRRKISDDGRFDGNGLFNNTVAALVGSVSVRIVLCSRDAGQVTPGKFIGRIFRTNSDGRQLCVRNFLDLDGSADEWIVLVAGVDGLHADLDGGRRRGIGWCSDLYDVTTRGKCLNG